MAFLLKSRTIEPIRGIVLSLCQVGINLFCLVIMVFFLLQVYKTDLCTNLCESCTVQKFRDSAHSFCFNMLTLNAAGFDLMSLTDTVTFKTQSQHICSTAFFRFYVLY